MSGRIAKSQVPILSRASLPPDARAALIEARNALRARGLARAVNEFAIRRDFLIATGPPLPAPSQGCEYYECDVAAANERDATSSRGRKRLVLEVNTASLQVLEPYFTAEHYAKFSFFRIV